MATLFIAATLLTLAKVRRTTGQDLLGADTYAPFLMKGPSYPIRERQWREEFEKNDAAWFCFVVERPDGQLVGFAQGNRSDHPEFAGQLNKIYLLRDTNGSASGHG